MKPYAMHIGITLAAVSIAVAHMFWPDARIDAVTVTLVVIALLPWLGAVFRSVELPGGLKVEYKDLAEVGRKAEEAGLVSKSTPQEVPIFVSLAAEDPNLALAGLRIEIERRLRSIAAAHDLHVEPVGVGTLLRVLGRHDVLSKREQSVLADLIGILNGAVHGASVNAASAQWALKEGSRLLASLDERAQPRN